MTLPRIVGRFLGALLVVISSECMPRGDFGEMRFSEACYGVPTTRGRVLRSRNIVVHALASEQAAAGTEAASES
jgi:peptide deformylase